ncbi:DUF1127 domain-containing protein [Tabrizicola sp.]|uniref:DUF1127 domain-containing protein n=1 Tax=Tabrizicola sp. TaxID=2005166 RepID=UPI001A614663|nr:DUF1127 domain-containing protein [Tabrizicola sp.]MBL9074740.1 DUF1127 domain-containing protein [Tabrizicola sp.]
MPTRFLTRPLAFLRPGTLAHMPHRLLAAAAIARSRHSLRHLDDRLLADIGLTRAEALSEAERAPWDAPAHWKG